MTSRRERLGWALLFGLPAGVGVAVATARMGHTGLAEPLVILAGVTTALGLAGLVFGAASVGETNVDEANVAESSNAVAETAERE
jgi:hypothetical protein